MKLTNYFNSCLITICKHSNFIFGWVTYIYSFQVIILQKNPHSSQWLIFSYIPATWFSLIFSSHSDGSVNNSGKLLILLLPKLRKYSLGNSDDLTICSNPLSPNRLPLISRVFSSFNCTLLRINSLLITLKERSSVFKLQEWAENKFIAPSVVSKLDYKIRDCKLGQLIWEFGATGTLILFFLKIW